MSSPLSFFRAFATAGAFVITVTAAAGAAPETAGTNAALDALPLVVAERFDTPDALAKWTRLQGTANVAGGVATLRGVTQYVFPDAYLRGDCVIEYDYLAEKHGVGVQFNTRVIKAGNWISSGYFINARRNNKPCVGVFKFRQDYVSADEPTPDRWTHCRVEYTVKNHTVKVFYNNSKTPALTLRDRAQPDASEEGCFGFCLNGDGTAKIDNIVVRGTKVLPPSEDAGLTSPPLFANNFILFRPLLDEEKISHSPLPAHYKMSIVGSEPAGFIDTRGNVLKRPAANEPDQMISVRVRITDTRKNNAVVVEQNYPVPIPPRHSPLPAEQRRRAAEKAKTDFVQNKKLALFVTYGPRITGNNADGEVVDDIDVVADSFNAPQFAKDAAEMGCDYVIFSIGHIYAYTLFPSITNKRWRDDRRATPDFKTYSKRDLIADLANELDKYGIDLHLYFHTSDGHDFSRQDKALVGFHDDGGVPDTTGAHWGDLEKYRRYYYEIFDEICRRYSGKIKGLWYDGMWAHYYYNFYDAALWRRISTTYNAGMILSTNIGGARGKVSPEKPSFGAYADYNAFEINDLPDFKNWVPNMHHGDTGTWILTPAAIAKITGDFWWSGGAKRLPGSDWKPKTSSAAEHFRYLVLLSSISLEGGYQMATGCYADTKRSGDIFPGRFDEMIKEMNAKYLLPVRESIKGTLPGKAFVTGNMDFFNKTDATGNALYPWGVQTESPDEKTIYLHILRTDTDPLAKTVAGTNAFGTTTTGEKFLLLPPTQDGSILRGPAALLNYDGSPPAPVKLEVLPATGDTTGTTGGYKITLPAGRNWHPVDTVIKLKRK